MSETNDKDSIYPTYDRIVVSHRHVCSPATNDTTTETVRRYNVSTADPGDDRKPWGTMLSSPTGKYVLASDYDRAIARIAELEREVAREREQLIANALRHGYTESMLNRRILVLEGRLDAAIDSQREG